MQASSRLQGAIQCQRSPQAADKLEPWPVEWPPEATCSSAIWVFTMRFLWIGLGKIEVDVAPGFDSVQGPSPRTLRSPSLSNIDKHPRSERDALWAEKRLRIFWDRDVDH